MSEYAHIMGNSLVILRIIGMPLKVHRVAGRLCVGMDRPVFRHSKKWQKNYGLWRRLSIGNALWMKT